VTVILLHVVPHDWFDSFARKILSRLREATVAPLASSSGDGNGENLDKGRAAMLIIADQVLPLACVDDFEVDGEENAQWRCGEDVSSFTVIFEFGQGMCSIWT
jgi:hypothetical protein